MNEKFRIKIQFKKEGQGQIFRLFCLISMFEIIIILFYFLPANFFILVSRDREQLTMVQFSKTIKFCYIGTQEMREIFRNFCVLRFEFLRIFALRFFTSKFLHLHQDVVMSQLVLDFVSSI